MWSTALETVGANTADSGGTHIVGSGTANTKGPYAELDASTAFLVSWFFVHFGHAGQFSGSGEVLFDVATGAAASEVVLIANFNLGYFLSHAPQNNPPLLCPVAIASGTRLSARCQLNSTLTTADMLQMLLTLAEQDDVPGSAGADTYGADTSDSGGTLVDCGGVANTKGSYAEITAATAAAHNWLQVNLGNNNDTAREDSDFLMDIAVGAAASEVVIIPNLFFAIDALIDRITAGNWSIGIDPLASGVRLSARAQCEITTAGNRAFDVILIGFNIAVPGSSGGGGGGSMILGCDGVHQA